MSVEIIAEISVGELRKLLQHVPDDAEFLVCGAPMRCMYRDPKSGDVSVDTEFAEAFMDDAELRQDDVLFGEIPAV